MIPLVGYADRLSVRPGETIRFHVSNATGREVASKLVRVISADANPAGPGVQLAPVDGAITLLQAPRAEVTDRGSFARVDTNGRLSSLESFTILATIWPTRLGKSEQPICGWFDDRQATGFSLIILPNGQLSFVAGHGEGRVERWPEGPALAERAWVRVACCYDAKRKAVEIRVGAHARETFLAAPVARAGGSWLVIGASPTASFDGKIERPMLFDRALEAEEIDAAVAGTAVAGLVAAWDFSQEMATEPHRRHRTERSAWPADQRAGARDDRHHLERARDVLSPCARAVRRHPFSFGRSR